MTELTSNESGQVSEKTCISCGSPDVVTGHANALCANCRTAFINYPIPKWVWLFAGGIGVLLLFSLVNLPKNISLGIDLERGIKSVNDHKYVTAEKELKSFIAKMPESEEGNAYLMIASYNNLDFETLGKAFERIKSKEIDDKDLYNRVATVMDNTNNYFPSDSLDSFYAKYQPADTIAMYAGLKEYTASHPDEIYAQAAYGAYLLGRDEYSAADSIYDHLLQTKGDFLPAMYAMAGIKRMEDKPEEAVAICDKILDINTEDSYAMSIKARALLRLNKNAEALHLAEASEALEPNSQYNTATLALVYHFNKMKDEENKMVKAMSADKDSSAAAYYQYALDVISNKETFR